MVTLCKKNECTGCLACVSLQCEHLHADYDDEGFIQPIVHESCTECGRCVKVCPQLTKYIPTKNFESKYFACVAKDESVLPRSSSGGLFSVLALTIIRKQGVVFGTAFNPSMELEHIAVEKEEALSRLCGSKYLQSDIGDSYGKVKSYLTDGRHVLFCGLPCQIDGLNHFLGNQYPAQLITVDILCKGVPSPKVFSTFVRYYEDKYNDIIKNINFRDKSAGWGNALMCISFQNGQTIKRPLTQTSFGAAFSTNLIMRESCYECRYRGLRRIGDISLGDYWGIIKTSKFYKEKAKGVSFVSVNTAKGAMFFEDILKFIKYETVHINNVILNNSALRTEGYSNKKRIPFFNDFKKKPKEALLRHTRHHRWFVRIKSKVSIIGRLLWSQIIKMQIIHIWRC